MISRRALLGGTALVAGTGIFGRAIEVGAFADQYGAAAKPWQTWRDETDRTLGLVDPAILAASPHNSQPWLFAVGERRIDLHADPSRNLGGLDPFRREQHVALGCALENLATAAAACGYRPMIRLGQGRLAVGGPAAGSATPIRIALEDGPVAVPLTYRAIPHRRTNRSPYQAGATLPADFLQALDTVGVDLPETRLRLFPNGSERRAIARLVANAGADLYSRADVQAAAASWTDVRPNDIQSRRDGIPVASWGLAPWMQVIIRMLPERTIRSIASGQPVGYYEHLIASSSIVGAILVRDRRDVASSIQAGRLWERIHLLAALHGLAGAPVNEAVELADSDESHGQSSAANANLAQLVGADGWAPTFMFRLGIAEPAVPASPRRPPSVVTTRL